MRAYLFSFLYRMARFTHVRKCILMAGIALLSVSCGNKSEKNSTSVKSDTVKQKEDTVNRTCYVPMRVEKPMPDTTKKP